MEKIVYKQMCSLAQVDVKQYIVPSFGFCHVLITDMRVGSVQLMNTFQLQANCVQEK